MGTLKKCIILTCALLAANVSADECDVFGTLAQNVAEMRDAGISKQEAHRMTKAKADTRKLAEAVGQLIDMIYSHPTTTPAQYKMLMVYACRNQ